MGRQPGCRFAVELHRPLPDQGRRLTSPHYLVGESYGGIRGPKIAHHLQTNEGVGINGIVLLSPALDYGFLTGGDMTLLPDMARLPSMAAVALSAKGPVTPDMLKPVEQYAAGDYLLDLAHGRGDPAAQDRVAAKVAALIGLDPKLVRQLGSQSTRAAMPANCIATTAWSPVSMTARSKDSTRFRIPRGRISKTRSCRARPRRCRARSSIIFRALSAIRSTRPIAC